MITKTCTHCIVAKPLTEFSKKVGGAFGVQSKCKACYSIWYKAHYAATSESKMRSVKERYEKKRESILQYTRQWRRVNSEKIAEHYERTKSSKLAHMKAAREANLDFYRAKEAAFWRKNPDKQSTKVARRRAALIRRYPLWADAIAIEFIYCTRRWISKETGFMWHVDRLVPLLGRRVSGLHVHFNLRVIPAKDNMVKSNTFQIT